MARLINETDLIRGNKFICVFEKRSVAPFEEYLYLGKVFVSRGASVVSLALTEPDGTKNTKTLYSLGCTELGFLSIFREFSALVGEVSPEYAERIILAPLDSITEEERFMYELSGSWEHVGLQIDPYATPDDSILCGYDDYDDYYDYYDYDYYDYYDNYCYECYRLGCSIFDPYEYEIDMFRYDDNKVKSRKYAN